MALIMVITLSLLVYSLAERRVRKALVDNREYIWDQKNRITHPSYNPVGVYDLRGCPASLS